MSDLRVPLGPILNAFGVPASVTRPGPGETAMAATGVWLRGLEEPQPVGRDRSKREPRKVFVIPRSTALGEISRNSLVVAPEILGELAKEWRVDGYERTEADAWWLILVLARP